MTAASQPLFRHDFICVVIATCTLSCSSPKGSTPEAVLPVPSEAQLAWHEMETNAFVHFTINTFTDKEWGYGDESPSLFNPLHVDVDQWTSVFKEAGFKGVVLTTKHHDGFCLWPSQYTEHSVKYSPYKKGQGDIVREVADACVRHGLKFGIYLSPWDRNRADYGTPAYIDYYRKQLRELFTNYGPVFEMWFDGANGGDGYYGGERTVRKIDGSTYYDWPETLNMVRELEPEVIFFSDAGPGVRWVGNERGVAGETNWNMITPDTLFAGKAGIENLLSTGSEEGTHWIPAEVDVSIRPGWFFHEHENDQVKTPEQLFDIYLKSVGRGSTLLLNVPPDKNGLLHSIDVKVLKGWRKIIDREFKNDIARNARVSVSNHRGNADNFAGDMVNDGDKETYWATDDGITSGTIELDFDETKRVKYIILQEYIRLGQRVKSFDIQVWKSDTWTQVASGTTIGYKRIIPLKTGPTEKVKITIRESKACPVISNVSVY